MRSRQKLLAPFVLAALAGGCVGDNAGMKSASSFGEANRQTMAAQIIDPDPVYESDVPPGRGDHAGQAVERYRTDKIKQPKRQSSTSTGGNSGGGGGSSGSN